MKKLLIIYSCFALLLATNCSPDTEEQQASKGLSTIARTENPGTIAVDSSMMSKEGFSTLATVYLVAASNDSPFDAKYCFKEGYKHIGISDKKKKVLNELVNYVRGTVESQIDIKSFFDKIKHPVSLDARGGNHILPGCTSYEHGIGGGPINYHKELYCLSFFRLSKHSTTPAKPSLQQLFQEDPTPTANNYNLISDILYLDPLPKAICLTTNPQVTEVIVPTELVVPVECTKEEKGQKYKLIGAFRGKEEVIVKKDGSGSDTIAEGLAYFHWHKKWFKVTSSAPTPQEVTETEVLTAAEKSLYNANYLSYLYGLVIE